MRPSDWFLVELDRDPTPGDAFGIRQLAAKYAEIANVAGDAAVSIRHARSSSASSAWVGDAGDIFRDRSARMPGELSKANDSYQQVADALSLWASTVDDTQAQADRGLQQARDAVQDLHAAQFAFGAAQLSWTSLHAQQLTYQKLVKQYRDVPPPPYVTLPTDHQIRSVDRGVQQAQSALAVAQAHVADAEARLAAAKALVMEAKSRRDEAEQRVVHQIGVAGDAAVQPSSIWEAIQDSAAWQTIVQIATVVLTIVSIVAIFVGGPLVWAIIAAATILLMVNALLSIAQGKDAWGELALLAVGLIPGGVVLGLLTRILSITSRVSTILRTATVVREAIEAVGAAKSGTVILEDGSRLIDPAFERIGTVMGLDTARNVFKNAPYTLGAEGRLAWVSPESDILAVRDGLDAVQQTGMAPSVVQAIAKGDPLVGVFTKAGDDVPLFRPQLGDDGGNIHFAEGGHTALRVNGALHINPTREAVTPGGRELGPGSATIFRLFDQDTDGLWRWTDIFKIP